MVQPIISRKSNALIITLPKTSGYIIYSQHVYSGCTSQAVWVYTNTCSENRSGDVRCLQEIIIFNLCNQN